MISAHVLEAVAGQTPLDVKAGTVTIDQGWAPFVQAQLSCSLPPVEVLTYLDPRKSVRVKLSMTQRFVGSQRVSDMSKAWHGTPQPEQGNLCQNPSIETNVSQWFADAITATGPAEVPVQRVGMTPTMAGANALRATFPATVTANGRVRYLLLPVWSTSPYSASLWVRSNRAQAVTLTLYANDHGGNALARVPSSVVTLAPNTWTQLINEYLTIPAGTESIWVTVEVDPSGVPWAANDVLYVDAVMLSDTLEVPPYFDGDTKDELGDVYFWAGTAHASASVHTHLVDVPLSGVSALYAGQTLAAMSSDFSVAWNATERPSVTRSFDLALRARTVDFNTGEVRLDLASDEALFQDFAHLGTVSVTPGGTSLRSAVSFALARIGAALQPGTADAVVAAESLAWEPGVSGWDYTSPIVQAGARRLWCDGQRRWYLDDPLQPKSGGLVVEPILKTETDTLDRDGDWADAVVVKYAWDTEDGLSHVAYDIAGPGNAAKVRVFEYDRPFAAYGAAAAILARLMDHGRGLDVSCVSDYRAEPGLSVTTTLPDGTTIRGMLSRVTFDWPSDSMVIDIADMSQVTANSWLSVPENYSWTAIPAGTSWTTWAWPQS